jgi:hypothetical protein
MSRLSVIFGSVILVVAFLVGSSVSQDGKKEGPKIRGMLPPGFKALNLSKAQVEKIYSIQITQRTKIADLNAQIADLKDKESREVFMVLTEAQRNQYLKSKGVDVKGKTKDKG